MLLDLARAILVAIAVLVLPGYLWARMLVPTADRAEALAYSLAFSFALIPTAILALVTLLGTGVTTGIALGAVAIVTLAGAAAHAVVGSQKDGARAPSLPAAPLSVPALAFAAVAALLMIVTQTEVLGIQDLWPLILLAVCAAAGVQLVGRRPRSAVSPAGEQATLDVETMPTGVGDGSPAREPSPRRARLGGSGVRRTLLFGVVAVTLVRGYGGAVLHEWPYVGGQDQYAHAAMTNLALSTGSAEGFLVYPPGFHLLVASLARLGAIEPLTLFPLLAPALLVLPVLACYTLATRLFGPWAALAAAFLAGLVLNSSYLFFYDGTYVDLIAAQFLLPLAVTALAGLLARPTARAALTLAMLGAAVVLYHSVATIYLALLLLLVSLVILPYLLLRDRRAGLTLFASLALLGALSVLVIWDAYDVPETVGAWLGWTERTDTTAHATMAIGTQNPRSAELVMHHIAQPVVWLGLLGWLLLAPALRREARARALAIGLVLAWALLFFLASRTSLSAFPIRFTRDLGIPLVLTGGFALVSILQSLRRRGALRVGATAVIALALALQVGSNLARASQRSFVLFLNPSIEAAGDWLRAHNAGGRIAVSAHQNQVSGNAMLALGGYPELQAYTATQLRQRRQVPPALQLGARAAWRITRTPGAPHVRDRLLAEWDIRYVVLYKRLNDGSYWEGAHPIDWRAPSRYPDLYTKAYENEYVVIYGVADR